jgi:hypothetical protein
MVQEVDFVDTPIIGGVGFLGSYRWSLWRQGLG